VYPAIVASLVDHVDLFPKILANIGTPKLACLAIKSDPPRIPKSIGIDLGTHSLDSNKWIVRRNLVSRVVRLLVNIDAKDRS
jgi:hypothetical protein